MKIKLLSQFLVILLLILLAACQNQTMATETSSSVELGSKPIATNMPTNSVGDPASNQSPSQTQESTSTSYPAPTSDVSLTSTIQQTTSPTSTTVATASPQNTESGKFFPLQCSRSGDMLQCVDNQLGMRFSYPSLWGRIKGELVNGTCGGFYYGYVFDPLTPRCKLGG